ncbi:MAG TPA: PEP/pyruvate-binding domain-containing protein, partial [Longimicrobiales bacterium]
AERIGFFLLQREIFASPARAATSADAVGKWRVVLDFLGRTDPRLVDWIARKMLNHLRWKGVAEAEALLRGSPLVSAPMAGADNRPLSRIPLAPTAVPAQAVFAVAREYFSDDEILAYIQACITQDKASFLVGTLEDQGSSLDEVIKALEHFDALRVDESELPPPVQMALRVALLRCFFSEDVEFINSARGCVTVSHFLGLARRVLHAPVSHGRLGGKSAGLFLAQRILEDAEGKEPLLRGIKVPRTWYIASDAVLAFVRHNNLEEVYDRKYMDIEQIRQEYPYVVHVFKSSHFPPELVTALNAVLDELGNTPLVVRSSSLLEDRIGAVFSGKYKSLFLANRGTKQQRLEALQDAIAEVYASIFGPDPIEYRAERNLLDVHEEMGIMIQEVVGTRVGRYYLPAYSGVAFSNNEFRWSPRIRREDGLVRLVPGLGTRAVDRLTDDYPVLLAPGQPALRVNTTAEEVIRYSPRMVDVIDLDGNGFTTVEVRQLLRECGNQLPLVRRTVSLVEDDRLRPPSAVGVDFERAEAVVTFDGLARETPFLARIGALLRVLRDRLGTPVDIEFACDGTDFYILQCRPQSFSAGNVAVPVPHDIPQERIVFAAHRYVSNGRVPDLSHVVYVDPAAYAELPEPALREVGRAVARLNTILPKRRFILMGPGRWGSRGDIRLGVSVTYSDVNNTAVLAEIAQRKGKYVPDLSFGTHFFQDLVEAGIRYLPLYPDEPGGYLRESFLLGATNLLPELAPDLAHLAGVVHVIDVPRETGGRVLRVLLDGDADEAVGFLADPPGAAGSSSIVPHAAVREELHPEAPADDPATHSRWRLAMAEKLAATLDFQRFGVRGAWLFGSTRNGSARADSDIDLLIHFAGSEEQSRGLHTWLEAWGLALGEMNYLRSGVQRENLLDVHVLSDEDIRRRTSYALKIDAVTDAARPLRLHES